jgi:aldehyde dehydrogenase
VLTPVTPLHAPARPCTPLPHADIGGQWVPPVSGEYFDVVTPTSGKRFTSCARGGAADIELALDAAHAAADAWGRTPPAGRAAALQRIAGVIREHSELLAYVETVDNGKPVRETLGADIPLAAEHFEYFAGCLRAQEGSLTQLDDTTVAYHLHEPLGVVGAIIPWNFPILAAHTTLLACLLACLRVHLPHASSPDALRLRPRRWRRGSWRPRWLPATPWC